MPSDRSAFKRRLRTGHARQIPVRDFFLARGYDVFMPELEETEDYDEAMAGKFAQQTDLWVNGYAIEVKNITEPIPDPPMNFKYNPIVDSIRGFRQKTTPPLAFVNRNPDTGAMGVIITKDGQQPDWIEGVHFNHEQQRPQPTLSVPRAKFRPMQELLDLLDSLPPLTNPT